MGTQICWTNETWNPVTGCTRASEGCRHCYAERLHSKRHRAVLAGKKLPAQYAEPFERIQLLENRLQYPYRWRKPRMIFVNSVGDLFHSGVPDEYIAKVFAVMNACPRHVFQLLTKRPERAAEWPGPWTANIWMGATVENRDVAHRVDTIRRCGARVRFLCFEPLIGPVGKLDLTGIHWAIVGGESGPERRVFKYEWARDIRDQCVAAGTAFYFKQASGAGPRSDPWLREEDGSLWTWRQYPGMFHPPEPANGGDPGENGCEAER